MLTSVILFTAIFSSPAMAVIGEAIGMVTGVLAGNVIWVEGFGPVVLADIASPQPGTSAGDEALRFTREWLYGRTVYMDTDDFFPLYSSGTKVAVVYLASIEGPFINFNRLMVDNGYATLADDPQNEFHPQEWWSESLPDQVYLQYPSLTGSQTGFVGSRSDRIYHMRDCPLVAALAQEDRIWLATVREAQYFGYQPCPICHPPSWAVYPLNIHDAKYLEEPRPWSGSWHDSKFSSESKNPYVSSESQEYDWL